MKNKLEIDNEKEHLAKAKTHDLAVSTKHSIEICNYLRYKTTNLAKTILKDLINLKKPIPFKKFNRDMRHRAGIGPGRFPQKAAKAFLSLIKLVEANAQFKGLNTSNLKIVKILANKASIPMTGGRTRAGTKRTHIEIEVKEMKKMIKKKKIENKGEQKK